MIKIRLIVFIVIPLLLSCSPNAKKSFKQLKQLDGDWVSNSGTVVYFKWQKTGDRIKGISFSLQKGDTLFFNRFIIEPKQDTLFLETIPAGRSSQSKQYHLTEGCCSKYVFEAHEDTYPYKITLLLKNDTSWMYKQENIRGHKTIAFDLKKIIP